MSVTRNTIVFALLAALGLGLAAFNTVRGAGQDLENAGEAVQDAAT